MIEIIKDIIFILLHPDFWSIPMLNEYDEEWDKEINKALEYGVFQYNNISKHSVSSDILEHYIWIRNYPYAYGTPVYTENDSKRPKRSTIYKLNKKIKQLKKENRL